MGLPRSMISLLLLLFIPCFASESIGYEPQEEEGEEFSEELLLKPLPDRKIDDLVFDEEANGASAMCNFS
ncbi:hypothetical protein LOK49_LG05G03454 [Camellia lanceoleosa]|uniref:Uncharacterized protein n=1 Tax=Camellia lanceoleosa TaxID=1840588 RepID=A0ACC0HS36_9ERIC|nr:hypothetical protein LOK49_LG05G03454 [Camellia lanceoleosa]